MCSSDLEIFNPEPTEADVSGWFLSDDPGIPKKYRLPLGSKIPAGGFLVLTETAFNAEATGTNAFSFSADGDEAYLFAADAAGNLTGYEHGLKFGASPAGFSFGRIVDSTGREHFPLMSTTTFGRANAAPFASDVVISEKIGRAHV